MSDQITANKSEKRASLTEAQQVEQRFDSLRKETSVKEWRDIHFLATKASELDAQDPLLANRIRLRITNLTKAATQQKENLEKRFHAIRQTVSQAEWENPSFLTQKAEDLQQTDAELAKRILLRVSNLKKSESQREVPRIQSEHQTEREPALKQSDPKANLVDWVRHSALFWIVILPVMLFAIYQIVIASERFESRAKLIIKQPDSMATMDASMALLSGFGVSVPGSSDLELARAYIYSEDMLDYLNQELKLSSHFLSENIDFYSRLDNNYSKEDFYDYFRHKVTVDIDEKASVIQVNAQGFTPEYAQQLTKAIVNRTEWYINKIGHDLAESQLSFIQGEHVRVENKLAMAKRELLKFQQRNNLLDPEAEGIAIQQIAYTLEAQLAEKRSLLNALESIMNARAPQVIAAKNEIQALELQLKQERGRLSHHDKDTDVSASASQAIDQVIPNNLSVGEILAKYAELKVGLELALQAYTSSKISLEKSRIEAYRQLKYLVVVESPTLPDENQYPRKTYNITLFTALLLLLYGIGRIVIATVNELK
ncbi:lipopolysaccharide biosynthesis protein [Photobacterium sp. TLY01]|uniref:lipopolysaccharide biosynthesis protein n=1 Tax=Photobacterium sp. TLY01 TaxID=2907534 RepID=UPI001F158E9D|nr:lipopolysaccharide biosynthesis protein [Photobacterium sp. TLY01]UIP27218.1 lipopolysaccharide biosynthesis protein [Photobacterium sp. TLY01]